MNTADFPSALLGDTNIPADGDTAAVSVDGIVASLTHIDQLNFIDGSVYEDNSTPGAQAALMFLGIFGRAPDPINAGGCGQVAEQSGTAAAAALMLATPEGSADTSGLTTVQFVTRLYDNILHRAPEPTGLAGWVAAISTGYVDRAQAVADFVRSPEAQTANAVLFATGSVNGVTDPYATGVLFAADPNAVDVLRAYETLLGRAPEASSLITDTENLNSGISLATLYTSIQTSAEFAADGPTLTA